MDKVLKELVGFRKELHQYPEVSQNETQTQKRIIQFLSNQEIQARKIGKTGVYVLFDSGIDGKMIMLRSDHDALPIQEINNFEHKSTIEGVSHKCGHDGHTAIMCGVAKHFRENPIDRGRLLLLFQPAEENGEGAKAVLNDPNFDFRPDLVFAFHNLPGYPLRRVVVKEGSFNAAVKSIIIELNGKTAHAAEPEMGTNPAKTISELITMFDEENQPDIDRDDFALTTPVHVQLGEISYGVSAGHAQVHYTIRTWSSEMMYELMDRLVNRIDQICESNNIKNTIHWTEAFEASKNDANAVQLIKSAAIENSLALDERDRPFKWGEDFGLFTQRFTGAMFGIGSGEECPALHNPDYDFPDGIIETGISMFVTIVKKAIDI
ncbi:amidohydrolase [Ekhidna sp.]